MDLHAIDTISYTDNMETNMGLDLHPRDTNAYPNTVGTNLTCTEADRIVDNNHIYRPSHNISNNKTATISICGPNS